MRKIRNDIRTGYPRRAALSRRRQDADFRDPHGENPAAERRKSVRGSFNRGYVDVFLAAVVVGDVDAPPLVADFLVMDVRIVDRRRGTDFGNTEPSDCRDQRIRRDQNVTLRGLEVDL